MNAKEKVIAENRTTALHHSPRIRVRRYEEEQREQENRQHRKFMPAAMYFPLNLRRQLQSQNSKGGRSVRRHAPTTLQLERGQAKPKHPAHN
jgi:hypothetical protein